MSWYLRSGVLVLIYFNFPLLLQSPIIYVAFFPYILSNSFNNLSSCLRLLIYAYHLMINHLMINHLMINHLIINHLMINHLIINHLMINHKSIIIRANNFFIILSNLDNLLIISTKYSDFIEVSFVPLFIVFILNQIKTFVDLIFNNNRYSLI